MTDPDYEPSVLADESEHEPTSAARAELLRLSGIALPGVRVSVQSLRYLERHGWIRESESGGYQLLPASTRWIPKAVFAGLRPGDQVVVEYSDHSGTIAGVVLRVEYSGHRAVIRMDDPAWPMDEVRVESWAGYTVLQVNSPGRLVLSQADDGSFTLRDVTNVGCVVTGLSRLDVSSLIVQLRVLTAQLP